METIVASVITGCITLIGVLIANGRTQAVLETKVEELTREVREHNHFARRMPVVEEQIKVINHILESIGRICLLWKKRNIVAWSICLCCTAQKIMI